MCNSIIGISIARLPALPGVVSSDDQPYSTVDATILGFFDSDVGHACATIPTIRGLVRLWCGSLDDASSRPSHFGRGWGSSTTSGGKRSSWFSKSGNTQSNASRNISSPQNLGSGKEKSAVINVQHHFGVLSVETQDSVALADLQPIRRHERAYQPPRHQQNWNSGRPRRIPEDDVEPVILREPWKDADVSDSSSETSILKDRGVTRTSSVRAIEAHIQSMEARMAALEAEVHAYKARSGRGRAKRSKV